MNVNSIAMSVEEKKTKYRFNRYLFPFVDCTITLYAESGEPVPISDIADCMREKYGIKGVRNIYEGRDAALDNSYVKTKSVGGRTRYVPVGEGVVHTAIYLALGDVINSVPPHALPFLIECVRSTLITILIPRLTPGTLEHYYLMRYLMDEIEFTLALGGQGEVLDFQVGLSEHGRRIMFELFVALKMLAGIEVMGLEPRYYSDVKKAIVRSVNLWLMPRRLSRPGLVRLFIDACRNTTARISAVMR
jgi:Mor family transcriptional regulator